MEVLWLPEMLGKALFDAFKNLCFFIDNIVYSFIPQLYKMILYLSNVDLYSSSDTIKALMNRIYILVGIFMLFKLSFSMIKYVADPNAFSDQSKGFTNLVKNSIIALFLLVTIPWMFQKAYEIQGVILTSNIVPNLIMGTDTEQIDINNMESSAKDIQFLMFGPFFSINTDIDSLKACEPSPSGEYSLSNIIGTTDMALKENCLESFSNAMNEDENVRSTNTTLDKFFRTSDDPNEDKRNFGSLASLITWSKDDKSVINYLPVASTLCGGYLVFLLLTFCIDIAGRAIKLMFLQVLSPVAVVSSIDPTESSQNGKLKEWLKECIKTFASVFVRLAILFFVIEMMKVITEVLFATASGKSLYYQGNLPNPSGALNVFIYIFLIIGAFQMAKKIPELLEKALGVKFSGEINMNPFKALKETVGFGMFTAGASAIGGALGAGIGGLASNAIAAKNTYKHQTEDLGRSSRVAKAATVGSVLAGGFSGAARGMYSGFKNKNVVKGASAGIAGSNTARNRRDVNQSAGYKFPDRVMDRVYSAASVKNKDAGQGQMDARIKELTKQRENYIASEQAMRDELAKFVARSNHSVQDFEKLSKYKSYDEYLAKNGGNMNADNRGNTNVNVINNSTVRSNANISNTTKSGVILPDTHKPLDLGEASSSAPSLDNQPDSSLISREEFEKYNSLVNDIGLYDERAEELRKEIGRYQDSIDSRTKNKQ